MEDTLNAKFERFYTTLFVKLMTEEEREAQKKHPPSLDLADHKSVLLSLQVLLGVIVDVFQKFEGFGSSQEAEEHILKTTQEFFDSLMGKSMLHLYKAVRTLGPIEEAFVQDPPKFVAKRLGLAEFTLEELNKFCRYIIHFLNEAPELPDKDPDMNKKN